MAARIRSFAGMYPTGHGQLLPVKGTHRCRARELLSLKDFMHSVQVCGLSPVWTRICTVRADLWMNSFPHSSHLYGLYKVSKTSSCNGNITLNLNVFVLDKETG
jgi:hypothetical protein